MRGDEYSSPLVMRYPRHPERGTVSYERNARRKVLFRSLYRRTYAPFSFPAKAMTSLTTGEICVTVFEDINPPPPLPPTLSTPLRFCLKIFHILFLLLLLAFYLLPLFSPGISFLSLFFFSLQLFSPLCHLFLLSFLVSIHLCSSYAPSSSLLSSLLPLRRQVVVRWYSGGHQIVGRSSLGRLQVVASTGVGGGVVPPPGA